MENSSTVESENMSHITLHSSPSETMCNESDSEIFENHLDVDTETDSCEDEIFPYFEYHLDVGSEIDSCEDEISFHTTVPINHTDNVLEKSYSSTVESENISHLTLNSSILSPTFLTMIPIPHV